MNGIDHHSAYEKCTVDSVEVIKSLSDSKIEFPQHTNEGVILLLK